MANDNVFLGNSSIILNTSQWNHYAVLSNALNNSRVFISCFLDEPAVPKYTKGFAQMAITFMNNQYNRLRDDLAPYHFIIDSNGTVLQNIPEQLSSHSDLLGEKCDIGIFIPASSIVETSPSQRAALAELIAELSAELCFLVSDTEVQSPAFLEGTDKDGYTGDVLWRQTLANAVSLRNAIDNQYSICEDIDALNGTILTFNGPIEEGAEIYFETASKEPIYYRYGAGMVTVTGVRTIQTESWEYRVNIDYEEIPDEDEPGFSRGIRIIKKVPSSAFLQVVVVPGTQNYREIWVNPNVRPLKLTALQGEYLKALIASLRLDTKVFEDLNPQLDFDNIMDTELLPEGMNIVYIPYWCSVDYDTRLLQIMKNCDNIYSDIHPYI